MSWIPSQNISAARRRQIILDFLCERPGAKMREISAHVSGIGDPANTSNTIRTMCDWREIRHEGNHGSRRYYALVATTRSAEECKSMRDANLAAANALKQQSAAQSAASQNTPGHYVHKPGKNPTPNQGGQGALRATVYIKCGGIYA